VSAKRHPNYDPELRAKALDAYRRLGSIRKAAAEIGRSVSRTHELVHDALAEEMSAADTTTTKGTR
jgi:hypothetical protein